MKGYTIMDSTANNSVKYDDIEENLLDNDLSKNILYEVSHYPRKLYDYNCVISSVDDYLELKDTLSHYYSKYFILFRGHADKRWSLVPSIMREPKGSFAAERNNYPVLKDFLISLDYHNYYLDTFNEEIFYMGIGRHLGIKSRLLDWTASMDVAVDAFLLDDNYINIDGELWLMIVPKQVATENSSPFDISDNDIHIFSQMYYSPDDASILFPAGIELCYRQHGYFSVTSETMAHLHLMSIPTKNGIVFERLRIPASVKSLLRDKRDNKKYQGKSGNLINYSRWYSVEELHEKIKCKINEMNAFITDNN